MAPPETLTWIGICVFAVLSLVTHCHLSGGMSRLLPSAYQLIALEGLGQMYVTNFVYRTGIETRNVASVVYFVVAIINVGLTLFAMQRRGNPEEDKTHEQK